MEIHYITWQTDDHRCWCAICPSLSMKEKDQRTHWCFANGMDFYNLGVNFYFSEEKDVMLFKLRWA
jgi:hypothetical protein